MSLDDSALKALDIRGTRADGSAGALVTGLARTLTRPGRRLLLERLSEPASTSFPFARRSMMAPQVVRVRILTPSIGAQVWSPASTACRHFGKTSATSCHVSPLTTSAVWSKRSISVEATCRICTPFMQYLSRPFSCRGTCEVRP